MPNLTPKIAILLSHERSGSHLVGEFMASLANVRMVDEICNPRAVVPTTTHESFHHYRYEAFRNDPALLLEPTRERHAAFVRSYFEFLLEANAPESIVVDIKYGHVPNFEYWWWPILGRPSLLKYAENEGYGIIHLYRENVVEAAASQMIAGYRRIWHSWEVHNDRPANERLRVPAGEVVRRALLLRDETRLFTEWTSQNRILRVTYERVARDLGRATALDTRLIEFVGGAVRLPFNPRHRKVTPPLTEILENYGELKRACAEAGLAEFLD